MHAVELCQLNSVHMFSTASICFYRIGFYLISLRDTENDAADDTMPDPQTDLRFISTFTISTQQLRDGCVVGNTVRTVEIQQQ